jgi:S1-C subfamily serine protease
MGSLEQFSEDIAAALEKVGPSVVEVHARRGRGASGIVWGPGLVLTSDHVLQRDEGITVGAAEGELPATIAGRDGASDLALLRVEGLAAPGFERGGGLKLGNVVLAVGRPGSLQATMGVVGRLDASFRGWGGSGTDGLIETDAELRHGFSGGPLADAAGRVAGVNSWYYGRGTTRALPLEAADRIAKSLQEHGRVRHSYLGIGTQPVYLAEAARAEAGQDSGLMVISVEDGSPSGQAGVAQGDIVIGLGEHRVARMRELFVALRRVEPGSAVPLKLVRAGKVATIQVTPTERAE